MNVLLVSVCVFVHCVYLMSIFDMYFRSPVVNGMTPHSVSLNPPAKRLVLVSIDGVRADKFFGLDLDGETLAPFLREILQTRGSWGLSHTRVPTETRPCHVALLAGFYEDLSAVTKGWKENPVNFDSILNQSRRAWCWGSSEVLLVFDPADGTGPHHVTTFMYPDEYNDFGQADATILDSWVFERVEKFFQEASEDATIQKEINQERVILFIHLMATDTIGHVHKPFSDMYLNNIRKVDRGIKRVVEIIDNFFQDNQTAYIVTSDHGMTDWGSHGAGDKHETVTPLVAWGAGISGPEVEHADTPFRSEISPDSWGLGGYLRKDVSQADLTPLMATLIDIPIPVNSVGTLPLSYINASLKFKAYSMMTNAKQMLEQLVVKESRVKASTLQLHYKPYEPLSPSKRILAMREVDDAIRSGKYTTAIHKANDLIKTTSEGMRYYEKYDRYFVGATVVIGFLGWIICIKIHIFKSNPDGSFYSNLQSTSSLITFAVCSAAVVIIFVLFTLSSPITYYFYSMLPLVFCYYIIHHQTLLVFAVGNLQWRQRYVEYTLTAVLAFLMMEILIFSFYWRSLIFGGCCILAVWPLTIPSICTKRGVPIVVGWMSACLAVGVFLLIHLPGPEHSIRLMSAGVVVCLMLVSYCIFLFETGVFRQQEVMSRDERKHSRWLLGLQLSLTLLSAYIAIDTVLRRNRKLGLSALNQTLSWLVLLVSFFLPSRGSKLVLLRLLHIALTFLPPYILLTMDYETIFYAALCVLLFFWLQLESLVSDKNSTSLTLLRFDSEDDEQPEQREMTLSDIRIAVFFLFFILTAFFGTGNIASINTFNPSAILCFVSVFNPFVMGGLLLWKMAIPFILVCAAAAGVQLALQIPVRQLFMVILLISDFMALHFFFMVKDYGSWMEIGMSISHFVVMITMTVVVLLVFTLAQLLTGSVKLFDKKNFKKII